MKDTLTHANARYACVITAAAIYARVFLYVYIISVSLKDLIIISVVITVDVKVYTEAMLINTIYSIFNLSFTISLSLSLLSLYSYFSRQLMNDSPSSPPLNRISNTPNAFEGHRNIFFIFNSRHRGFDFTRACVSLLRRGTCKI